MNLHSILSIPGKIIHGAKIELLALLGVMRFGIPGIMLQFGGGIGDELLLTAVAHELKLRNAGLKIWQISHSVELLQNNTDYARVLDFEYWPFRHALFLNKKRLRLTYAHTVIPQKIEEPPDIHILAELCRKAGINGEVSIRPYFYFSPGELAGGKKGERQIVIQCCGTESYATVMRNKLWQKEGFQKVVEGIRQDSTGGLEIIQIGNMRDPLLKNVTDLRGKSTIRETAAILANADCFIGTVGFLMHLARAVECRSVIIYGGREHSFQTGYICNENLDSFVECAPCWLWNDCDYNRKCMGMITTEDVLAAVKRVIARSGQPLETEVITL